MNTQTMSADNEYEYLASYALVNNSVGSCLFLLGISSLSRGMESSIGTGIATAAFFSAIAVMIFSLWQLRKYPEALKGRYMFTKQSWAGSFDDEFLNLVNLKGYKVAFFACMIISLVGFFGLYDVIGTSVEVFLKLLMGAMFVSYGVTVRRGLRDDHD